MSVGNLKDQGNKGNNFPYQLAVLKSLGTLGTETTLIDILNAIQSGNSSSVITPTSLDAFGRLRTSSPLTLFDSSHRYSDNGLWNTSTSSGGTAIFNADRGLVNLIVTSTLGSEVIRETKKVFSYQPGKSLQILNTFVGNNRSGFRQRIGYFNESNGIFLQIDSGNVSFVLRSFITGSVNDTIINSSNWNGDPMDGSGPSGIVLDITKAQIFWMDIEWLGVGSVRCGFVIDGKFILCHTFNHANIIESTYMTTACLPLRYELKRTLSGFVAPGGLAQICSSVISEGGYELRGAQRSVEIPITGAITFAANGVYLPIISLKLKPTRLDAIVILTALSLVGKGNGKNYSWRIVEEGTTTGGAWIGVTDSAVQYNISGSSTSGGRIIASGFVNSSNQGSPVVNILKDALFANQLQRDGLTSTPYELSLQVAVDDASGTNGVLASVDWEEITR